jgi:thiamine biosynthesis lipoprotein
MIYVFEAMGTVVSIEPPLRVPQLERVFADLNSRYSLYRPDSELSRIADGSLRLIDASQDLRDTYSMALEWRSLTGGAFTPHRPDGVIDLSGIVKAIAMDAAGSLLADSDDWILNVGGDVLTSAQVTVVANDIITADVLATAIVSGGVETLNASTSAWDIDVLAIDLDGNLYATPGFTASIGAAAALPH